MSMNIARILKDANEQAEDIKASAISAIQEELNAQEILIQEQARYVVLGRIVARGCWWDARTRSFSFVADERAENEYVNSFIITED